MRTGNGKTIIAEPRAIGVRIEKGRLIVEFNDDREVSVPLNRYPTLQKARPAQRSAWKLIGRGIGFHWEAIDLDLSVQGLISGLPEAIPRPPELSQRASPAPMARRRSA